MALTPAISLVTLGVRDVPASTAFYQALGFPLSSASVPGEVSFFRSAGAILTVWSANELAGDAGVPARADAGFRGVGVAINCLSREQVDEVLAAAAAAGATIT